MALPVFIEENIGDINGDFQPQYDVDYFLSTGKMRLLNPITVEGTLHNADTMNNLINFGNDYSFPNSTKITTFPTGKMFTEWRQTSNNNLIASIELDFSTMTKTYKLYANNGTTIIQTRKTVTTFPTGQIKQVVTI